MPNRLSTQTSPYLLQHAQNPVDWYPWGEEALQRATAEQKPIFLSIGYSTCHWCHVMEKESFENPETAEILNKHFVCIKVDREERPDIDEVYMQATLMMTGQGGWPMSVFLTTDQRPFFAGTYFPPEQRYGRPGFKTLLLRIAELWQSRRDDLVTQASALAQRLQPVDIAPATATTATFEKAFKDFCADFDPQHGGFGGAPKFPSPMALEFLLRYFRRTQNPEAWQMVEKTLLAMAHGGIYDQVGGGFARYSTDEAWLVPHFEKMLYDNASLAKVYLQAFQASGNTEFKRVASEVLDYICREMTSPLGGYYSATDADSEGVEGKFFVWTLSEIEALLPPPYALWFVTYYNVTSQGNFEGSNILHVTRSVHDVAPQLQVDVATLEKSLNESRQRLYEARSKRIPPHRDDKIITAWNALMISAMALGFRLLDEQRYFESAEKALQFIWQDLRSNNERLLRSYCAGQAKELGFLGDYAYLLQAILDFVEAGGAKIWLTHARELADDMLRLFGDDLEHGFFHNGNDSETLITRFREGHDGALPSGNAAAAQGLARLAKYLDDPDLWDKAQTALNAYGSLMAQSPRAFAQSLCTLDFMETAFSCEGGVCEWSKA
jgi:uncharacterized protein